jgi:ribose transport system substrate-binding protein
MTRVLAAALSLFITASAALISTVSGLEAKTLGIVALIANDALNVAVIAGATDAAKAAGWDVKVVDTQASADQANAGMSSFAVQKVDAIMVLAFASSSIGSGLAAANAAGIPVARSCLASSSRPAARRSATTRPSTCSANSATTPIFSR